MKKLLYWLPRILAILITAFWFVFVMAHGKLIEILMESGIWAILLLLTILAWKDKLVGKLGFIVLGIFYIILVWNRVPSKLIILEVAGPVILTGLLFLFSKKAYRNLPKKHQTINQSKKEIEDNGKII